MWVCVCLHAHLRDEWQVVSGELWDVRWARQGCRGWSSDAPTARSFDVVVVVVVDCRFNYPAAQQQRQRRQHIFTRLATAGGAVKTETETGHLAGYGFSLNWSFRLGVDANDDVAISSNTNARASLPPTLNKNFIHKNSQKQTNEAKKAMDTSHACAARTATKWRGKTYYTPQHTHTHLCRFAASFMDRLATPLSRMY